MKRFKNILCVIELEENSSFVLEEAIELALKNNAKLTVVNIEPKIKMGIKIFEKILSNKVQEKILHEKEKELSTFVKNFSSKIDIKTKVLSGTPFLEIIYEVLRNKHDLVIKAPYDMDWTEHLLGSNDMHLIRKCPSAVWMIKKQKTKQYSKILATVDIDAYAEIEPDLKEEIVLNKEFNNRILQIGASLAISNSAKLNIIHVWDAIAVGLMKNPFANISKNEIDEYVSNVEYMHKKEFNTLIDEAKNHEGKKLFSSLRPKKILVSGVASEKIVDFIKKNDIDLVIMGTVGRTGISGFTIGNTAEDVLSEINCSVVAIKPPGYISPVTLDD